MKCYWVSDANHQWQQVLFAEDRKEAIYKSDGYQNEGVYIDVRVRRKKEWDQYAELGYVPKEVMIQDGWWFECYGYKQNPRRRCCAHITEEENYKAVGDKVFCEDCSSQAEMEISA